MTRAIIVGAGVTGPVTALALQKAGVDSRVYEAYDRGADGIGSYLTLATNGLAALETIGMRADQLDGGFDTSRMVISSSTGRELARFSMSASDGTQSYRTIRRSDLYSALRDEAERRGVSVSYGKRLIDIDTRTPGMVIARFADGSSAEGDLLIGADGLWSRTRALIDPSCPRPRYTGLQNTGGYAHGIDLPGDPGTFHMTFGRRAFFAYVKHPSGDVWWFANVPARREETAEALAAIGSDPWRARLVELFRDDHTPARALLAQTDAIATPWNTYDLPTVPQWHGDRTVLVGDAAHAISPTSGQGASLSLEDAVMLARCLRDLPDLEHAFASFELARRERVERIIAQSKQQADRKIPGPFSRVVRDRIVMPLVMAMMSRGPDRMAEVNDYRIDWDSPAVAAR